MGDEELDDQQSLGGILSNGMYTTQEARDEALGILKDYRAKYGGESSDAPERKYIDRMQQSADAVKAALKRTRERLLNQRYNPGEALLAAAGALGRPTRTGSIGETMSNTFEAIRDPLARRRQFDREREDRLLDLDTAEANADQGVNSAEMQLEMLNRRLSSSTANKALEVAGRPVRTGAGAGSALRDRKILDVQQQLLDTGQFSVSDAHDRAVNIVDKNWDVVSDPDLGILRVIDKVNNKSYELPLAEMPKRPPPRPLGDEDAAPGPTDELNPPGGAPPAPTPGGPAAQLEEDRDPRDTQPAGSLTMWDAANLGTGLWSGIRSAISIPAGWVGLPVAQRTEKSRQVLTDGTQPLIMAMSVNDQYPVKEMERLREQIKTLPSVVDNPELMHIRMQALDEGLRETLKEAEADSADLDNPRDMRKNREVLAAAIRTFLPKLGVPAQASEVPTPDWLPPQYKDLWPYWDEAQQKRVSELLGGAASGNQQ